MSLKTTCAGYLSRGLKINMECSLCNVAKEDHRKRESYMDAAVKYVAWTVLLNMSRFSLTYLKIKNPSAILCLACDKQLRDVRTTEKKLELLRRKVTEKLERFTGELE